MVRRSENAKGEVFTSPDTRRVLTETQTLTGGKVLPGYRLKLSEPFAEFDEV
ncbi:MAG: hypothetical protein ACKV0T_16575 [Planctomycetales bacterium]